MRLDEGACAFGAGVLLSHLDALNTASVGVRQGLEDIEFVHDARVASRRLRAVLPLFIGCLPPKKARKWLSGIRRVTRALGTARDTDVQIEWLLTVRNSLPEKRYYPGVNRLLLRLRQQRAGLQADLNAAMDQLSASNLLPDMTAALQPIAARAGEIHVYTRALYQHSRQAISGRLADFLDYQAIVGQPEKVTELHEMRIAAKWLRYNIETFAPLYGDRLKDCLKAVKSTQDLLGEIHDCDVWQLSLPQFLEAERQRTRDYFGSDRTVNRLVAGITFLEQERLSERAQLYETFVESWQTWQAANLWDSLRAAIQVPFISPSQVYPPLRPAATKENA